MKRAATTSSLTITDPFIKYTTLVAQGTYLPDAAQYRLAHHLQKVYLRLKDYKPSPEYRRRLRQLSRALDAHEAHVRNTANLASASHPIRRNPLFARFFQQDDGNGQALGRESLALARVLTSHQAALAIDSPKGLFVSGEVGTGKSMLLDLLADGLPTRYKKRWHFNTFMLHTLSKLEHYRRTYASHGSGSGAEYSLLWLARELVETSPILFLDEFQLPDRAASKIMSHLFIAFFQLGGVLVASSNRMPEELEKATGGAFVPPATGGLVERVFALGRRFAGWGELYGASSDFAAFLEVLRARCEFWHVEGTRDFRRREEEVVNVASGGGQVDSLDGGSLLTGTAELPSQNEPPSDTATHPAMYALTSSPSDTWSSLVLAAAGVPPPSHSPTSWTPDSHTVYGRLLPVPHTHNGVAYFRFPDLVSTLGPADYITLACNYHTFIIDDVPVLPLSMKNEARRFITLLDALYEARCKLLIRAAAGPDEIFFPETRRPRPSQSPDGTSEEGDATYAETLSEVYQDLVSPFRPNTSSTYVPSAPEPSLTSPSTTPQIDFLSSTKTFTGEDERFAYKRATSRLWELCSIRWHGNPTEQWWMPLPTEARHWEGGEVSRPLQDAKDVMVRAAGKGEGFVGERVLEGPMGLSKYVVERLKKEEVEQVGEGGSCDKEEGR